MLVEQDAVWVETFWNSGSGWEPSSYENPDNTVGLKSVDLTISLRDIYRLVFA